jgi:outer membrane protein assembly factor BamB
MRNGRIGGLALAVLGTVLVLPASADNWPRFRGPNGTGISADKNIPVEWNDSQGVLWKVALPGPGNGSPVVWGDRLFLQSATPDASERVLQCFDVRTGKELWARSVPGGRADHLNPSYNTLASSTPATDGERVYVVFWDGRDISLHAYDFEGKQLWQQPLGYFKSQHGVGASPVVCGDRVILNNDQDGTATLVAFDARTGKLAWQAPRRAYRASYGTPFVMERPGQGAELIVASTTAITDYDPKTGRVNWNWDWKSTDRMPLRVVASPILSHGLILVCSGDGAGDRHIIAVRPGSKDHPEEARIVWENKRDFPYVPSMLAWGDDVYFVTDKGMAGCHDARSGARVWDERLDSAMTASPVLIDGKVYACGEDGDVYVFAAEPTFRLLARNALNEPIRAAPAVADGRLFIRGRDHLFCIGKAEGK